MRKFFIKNKLLPFLAVIGPGIIAANADNDAGGITTYSLAGAKFGYGLLWILIFLTISLAITQEMGARMGAVTGKGLGGLIREKFGAKASAFAIFIMLIANLGTTVAEFAGIQASLSIFNVPSYISIPIAAFTVYYLIAKFDFKRVQKVFLFSSLFYIAYIVSGVFAKPDWGFAVKSLVVPAIPPLSSDIFNEYVIMTIAIIGTTITPWGQFFIQSFTVDKRLDEKDLKYARIDVFFGAFVTNFIAFIIIVTCAATLWKSGITINPTDDAATLAKALEPLSAINPIIGRLSSTIFAFGLLNASLLGAAILPLTSSYAACETFGWESGIDKTTKEAPIFYGLFVFFILVSSIIIIIPNMPYIAIMFWAQIINGILSPIILIYALKITKDKSFMKEHATSGALNSIGTIIIAILVMLTIAMVITQIIQYFG